MSIVRTKKSNSNPYVMLDTTALNDARLSYRAKGLHTYLMSKPDGWHVYIEQLEKSSPTEGRDAVRTALGELQRAGYLYREKIRGEKGRMAGWATTIYETPTLAAQETQTSRPTETIGLADMTQPRSDQPRSDQPRSDQPRSANPQLVSIEEKLVLIEEDSPLSPPLFENVNGLHSRQTEDQFLGEGPSTDEPQDSGEPQTAHAPQPTYRKSVDRSQSEEVTTKIKPTPKKPGKAKQAESLLPIDFVLLPGMRTWAQEHAPSLNAQDETDKFMDWARSKGITSLDWVARWRNWMRKALEINPAPPPRKRRVAL